jgi:hypothetical protein
MRHINIINITKEKCCAQSHDLFDRYHIIGMSRPNKRFLYYKRENRFNNLLKGI